MNRLFIINLRKFSGILMRKHITNFYVLAFFYVV